MIICTPPPITIPPVAIPAHVLVVNSSGNLKGKDGTKKASLKSDMEGQSPIQVGYIVGVFVTPGVLEWDGVLSGSYEAGKLTKDGNGVTLDNTSSGSVEWSVITPATNPSPPPASDPGGPYPGTWTLTTANNTALTCVD